MDPAGEKDYGEDAQTKGDVQKECWRHPDQILIQTDRRCNPL